MQTIDFFSKQPIYDFLSTAGPWCFRSMARPRSSPSDEMWLWWIIYWVQNSSNANIIVKNKSFRGTFTIFRNCMRHFLMHLNSIYQKVSQIDFIYKYNEQRLNWNKNYNLMRKNKAAVSAGMRHASCVDTSWCHEHRQYRIRSQYCYM